MGSLKDEALKNTSEDVQIHQLTAGESGYLRLLNVSLQYHTLGQKIMTGFLYYVCVQRLGYKEGVNLQFKFDFTNEDNMLEVTLLPETLSHEQLPPQQPPTPPAPATNDPATEGEAPAAPQA